MAISQFGIPLKGYRGAILGSGGDIWQGILRVLGVIENHYLCHLGESDDIPGGIFGLSQILNLGLGKVEVMVLKIITGHTWKP